jgi:Cd2+/Zn2+-exporting ATPase
MLVKGGNVLDGLLHVKTVVFDKTGTLTRGVFAVAEIVPAPGVSEESLLQAALMAEAGSNHPIARSILAYAHENGLPDPEPGRDSALSIQEIPGKGMEALVDGVRYLVGTAGLLEENGISCPAGPERPGALVYVSRDGRCLGYILVSDAIRDDARQSVNDLRRSGLKTFMLTGDRQEAAAWTAWEVGLDGYRANLLPEGKVEALDELGGAHSTAFVGDGINDAPILALSRVGIAMGGMGAEAAIEAADAVILNDSPAKVPQLFKLARDVRSIAWQNIVMAVGIKVTFMALGVVGLSGLWEAVFADVGVALLAVLNATRILRK